MPTIELLPHQQESFDALLQLKRAILCDPPGYGKTVTVIAAANALGPGHRVLVVSPASVVRQWQGEVRKYSEGNEWDFCSYDELRRLPRRSPTILILDESLRVKSPTAQRTVAAFRKACDAPYTWLLNGTPIRNHGGDLFCQLAMVEPRLVEEYAGIRLRPAYEGDNMLKSILQRAWTGYCLSWHQTYNLPVTRYVSKLIVADLKAKRRDEWHARFDRYFIGHDREVLRLPPLRKQVERISFYDREAACYAEVAKQVYEADTRNALAYISRLRMASAGATLNACGVQWTMPNSKVSWAVDYLAPLNSRSIVFTCWPGLGRLLAEELAKRRILASAIFGNSSQRDRETAVTMFREGSLRVLITSPEVGAYGLNLQAADRIIWLDLPWTPDLLEQGEARSVRIGRLAPTDEIFAMRPYGIDLHIARTLRKKVKFRSQADAARLWLREMTGREVRL